MKAALPGQAEGDTQARRFFQYKVDYCRMDVKMVMAIDMSKRWNRPLSCLDLSIDFPLDLFHYGGQDDEPQEEAREGQETALPIGQVF